MENDHVFFELAAYAAIAIIRPINKRVGEDFRNTKENFGQRLGLVMPPQDYPNGSTCKKNWIGSIRYTFTMHVKMLYKREILIQYSDNPRVNIPRVEWN